MPDIEQSSRLFDEGARFYSTSRNERKYGKRYLPPPVAENLQQLLDEKLALEQQGKQNYLLNSRYAKQ